MSKFSDYLENKIVNFWLRGNPEGVVAPAGVYLALYKSDPTDANTGTECAATGDYARQQVTFSAPVDGVTSNTALVQFPIASLSWGTVTHIGIFDAPSGGNLLFHGAISPTQTINAGGRIEFPAGSIQISIL